MNNLEEKQNEWYEKIRGVNGGFLKCYLLVLASRCNPDNQNNYKNHPTTNSYLRFIKRYTEHLPKNKKVTKPQLEDILKDELFPKLNEKSEKGCTVCPETKNSLHETYFKNTQT